MWLRYYLLKDNKDILANILSEKMMLEEVLAAEGIGTSEQQR